jgi:hypothetical protein
MDDDSFFGDGHGVVVRAVADHRVAPPIAIAFAVKASRDSLATRCPRCGGRLGRLASEAAAVRSAKILRLAPG